MVSLGLEAFQTGVPTSPFVSVLPFVLQTHSRVLHPGWLVSLADSVCIFSYCSYRESQSYQGGSGPPGTPQAFDLWSGSKNLGCKLMYFQLLHCWTLSTSWLMQLALRSRKGKWQKGCWVLVRTGRGMPRSFSHYVGFKLPLLDPHSLHYLHCLS